MAKKTYHVTPNLEGRWVVRQTGSDRAEKAFETQRDAIDFAKKRARTASKKDDVDVIVHKKDGRISSRDSYGSDPQPPRDREH